MLKSFNIKPLDNNKKSCIFAYQNFKAMTIQELKRIVEKDLSLTKKVMNDGDDPFFDFHFGRADALSFIAACLNLVD